METKFESNVRKIKMDCCDVAVKAFYLFLGTLVLLMLLKWNDHAISRATLGIAFMIDIGIVILMCIVSKWCGKKRTTG